MLDALTELLDRNPFIPFRIVLTSGQSFDITNPHLVATGATMITIYPARSDRFAMLRLNQIASFESLERAA
jgi:hypothetical protein